MHLTTVGIDIGSSTSQLGFSRIELEQVDGSYVVTHREVIYQSDIVLTPYQNGSTIDAGRLGEFLDRQYSIAGIASDDIDSGVVILTGVALEKRNARRVADLFSVHAGRIVAVSAGDLIEATLACKGMGIEPLSRARGEPILHIDVGGGTTKYGYVEDGRLKHVAAVDVGARLVVLDRDRRILRLEPPAAMMLAELGVQVMAGDRLDEGVAEQLAQRMAREVLAHGGLLEGERGDRRLLRTPALFAAGERPGSRTITTSGGVSEYMHGSEKRVFGDLGRPLADALSRQLAEQGRHCLKLNGGIRATVLGASQYTVRLAGSTVYASSPQILPLRNVPVAKPDLPLDLEELDRSELSLALERSLAGWKHDHACEGSLVAIAVDWKGSATYQRVDVLARALAATVQGHVEGDGPARSPLIVVCNSDIAALLGHHIEDVTAGNQPIVSLDGIEVSDLDFLDLGAALPGTGTIPVVVKSLLFGSDSHRSWDLGSHAEPSNGTEDNGGLAQKRSTTRSGMERSP